MRPAVLVLPCLFLIAGCRGDGEFERMLERKTIDHLVEIRELSDSITEAEKAMQSFDPTLFAEFFERESIFESFDASGLEKSLLGNSEDVLVILQSWEIPSGTFEKLEREKSEDHIFESIKVHVDAIQLHPIQTFRIAAERLSFSNQADYRSVERFQTPVRWERRSSSHPESIRFGVALDRWIFPGTVVPVSNGTESKISVGLDPSIERATINLKQDRFEKQPLRNLRIGKTIFADVAPPASKSSLDLSNHLEFNSWRIYSIHTTDDNADVVVHFLKAVPIK